MSKSLQRSVDVALSLCLDAYGNGISGNTERSLRFLAGAVPILKAMSASLAHKGDIKLEMALAKALSDTDHIEETMPRHIPDPATIQSWLEKGLSMQVLEAVTPELEDAIARHGAKLEKTVVR